MFGNPVKPIFTILFCLLAVLMLPAQDKNPFQSIGKKGKIITLTNGKYEELFDQDSIQQIGTALVNIRQMKVVKLLEDKEAQKLLDNSASSRFLSVDPIMKEYPELTPYQFASNRPIDGIDQDGLEFVEFMFKLADRIVGKMDEKAGEIRDKPTKTTAEKNMLVLNGLARSTPFGAIHQLKKAATQLGEMSPEQRKTANDANLRQATTYLFYALTNPAKGAAKSIEPTIEKAVQGDYEATGELIGMVAQAAAPKYLRPKTEVPLAPSLKSLGEGITTRLVNNTQIKSFISTEPGAQGPRALSSIQNKINTKDWTVWAEPIFTTTYKDKTYILDGHNRLKVVSASDKPINVTIQELSLEEARKRFPDKIKDIEANNFNKKISDND